MSKATKLSRTEFALALGARLRAARQRAGLSLSKVEQQSAYRFPAVVVGSYERGDRHPTVERVAALAEFYGVPVESLVSSRDADSEARVSGVSHDGAGVVRVDVQVREGASVTITYRAHPDGRVLADQVRLDLAPSWPLVAADLAVPQAVLDEAQARARQFVGGA